MSADDNDGSGTDSKPCFSGKYTLERNENFDQFLAKNGVNWIVRKMICNAPASIDVTQDGNKFVFRIHSLVFTKVTEFTVDEEFEETQPNGIVMKALAKWDGNKLFMTYEPQKPDGPGKPQTCTREIVDDQLILTVCVEDVTAKRIFRRNH